jgi:hypothetical protein
MKFAREPMNQIRERKSPFNAALDKVARLGGLPGHIRRKRDLEGLEQSLILELEVELMKNRVLQSSSILPNSVIEYRPRLQDHTDGLFLSNLNSFAKRRFAV